LRDRDSLAVYNLCLTDDRTLPAKAHHRH